MKILFQFICFFAGVCLMDWLKERNRRLYHTIGILAVVIVLVSLYLKYAPT